MERKSFEDMDCPVALALDQVGEWWSLLTLRDALEGSRRFEQFRESLDISTTMLKRRLYDLVEAGILSRHSISETSSRKEYWVPEKGRG
ncbi:winged helix-turn-helix transcriptional regulator [Caballeronia sordidicola]|uniref:winged helix-turn-helix transcriptional regulator n=1 Tax=Caballeronia sordidicola TaxID=196367 RepID=UPI000691AB67|nr:helix-turn-helix domain-containing protein [Caballeronia sordidicola]